MPDNGQVERMNRTIKDATVRRYHYDNHEQLRRHLADFVAGRRLKTLKGLTPYESICKSWADRATTLQRQPAPPNAGTKHLVLLLFQIRLRLRHDEPQQRQRRRAATALVQKAAS